MEHLTEEFVHDGRAAARIGVIASQHRAGDTPQPIRLAIDAPAGFVRVQDGAVLGLRGDLSCKGRKDIRQPAPHAPHAPHVAQAALADREMEKRVRHAKGL